MDHSRYGKHEAIHLWKDSDRQVDLYIDRLSAIGGSDRLGHFDVLNWCFYVRVLPVPADNDIERYR